MLQIYKASAGSGKTHILTQDYLKLSFKYPNKFSRILAVTFTNKAAEEMKERIISEINNIIEKGSKAAHYKIISEKYKELTEYEIQQKALFIRNNILHNYSQFAISTIDSFVQKIVRAFAFEIKVPGAFKIEMDNEKVINDITDILYNKIADNKDLQKWLSKFALYKIEQGKNWDFRDDIKKLSYEIFKEKFQAIRTNKRTNDEKKLSDSSKLPNSQTSEHSNLNDLLNKTFAIKNGFENKMKEIANSAIKIIDEKQINISALGRNFKTIANYLTNKIIYKNDYEPIKTIYNALESEDNWYAKKAKSNVVETILDIYPQFSDLLEQAVTLYETDFPAYLTAKNVISNFHAFGVLNNIADILPEYRADNNLLLISDTTLLLKNIISNNETPFIYEKTGTKFQNILIDEFQDTSGFQWHNFRPLINNSLANGFFDLIVGDIKQSIYRWRGGDWKLLLIEVQKNISSNFINEETLSTNWRSKKNIIDFNNSIFKHVPEIAQKEYNTDFPNNQNSCQTPLKVSDNYKGEIGYEKILTSAYSDTYQYLSPKTPKTGGRVKINFIRVIKKADKQKKWRENINKLIPQTIDDLLKNKNYTAGDITILVRKNKEGKEIVDLLLDYQNNTTGAENYNIISGESLFINNSPSVRLLICCLKYILNNKDIINTTSLIYEYQKISQETTQDLHEIFDSRNKNDLTKFLPTEFLENINEFRKYSIYELVETLIPIFSIQLQDEEYPYIRTFLDTILSFVKDEYSDLHNFINYWEEKKNKISISLSDKQDAVNIMTIHKSKGLAFKIVIIPFFDWRLDHNPIIAPIIWCKSDKEPYKNYSFLPIKYKSELTQTYFQNDYYDEKLYAYMDAINMMYVAFTRPVEELIIMAPTDGTKKNEYISDLLFNAIWNDNQEITEDDKKYLPLSNFYDKENFIFENSIGYNHTDTKKFEKQQKYNNFAIDELPTNDWRKSISIQSHATDFFIESIKYIEEKVNCGNLMHEIFSKIITINDIDNAIQEMIFAGKIDSKERETLKNKFSEIISLPEVKEWFTDKWQVKPEAEILSSAGEIKIPDRILFGKHEIIVIDFKFGEVRKEYKNQLKEYMQIISEFETRKKISGYLLYGNQKKIVEVK